MENNKELLEATVKGLQDKLEQLQTELNVKTIELNNINKPKLNKSTIYLINDIVNSALEDYHFDCGMFEYEFNLGYDNKLELSDLTFTDSYDLVEAVVTRIEKQFKVIKDESTDTKQ